MMTTKTPKSWKATSYTVDRLARLKTMVAVWVAVPVTPKKMTNNNIRGGNVHQSQNNGGGWGGGWGGGSHNTQSMTNNNIRGGNVRQSQNNGGGWGGGSHNSQSMTGNTIDGASVSQTQNNGGGFPW